MAKKRNDITTQFRIFSWMVHIFLIILVLRLVQIQVLDRSRYVRLSHSQKPVYRDVQPQRGRIFDRNLEILAFNVPAVKIVANTDSIESPWTVAHRVAPVVSLDADLLYKKLTRGKGWIELTKAIPQELGERVKDLNLDFVSPRATTQRYYPKERTACQVVGFTRVDGHGGNGVELHQDSLLLGRKGMAVYQKTGRSRLLPHPRQAGIQAENGADIVLSLHSAYQKIVEEELAATVYGADAHSGIAVVMEPSTGDILAISSVPLYDPNNFTEYNQSTFKLRAITDQFEPGSTFKVASMAAMLEAGHVDTSQVIFCENGSYKAWDRIIRDTKPHADLTVHDIIVYSSNIGMAKLAKDFSQETLYTYLKKFGFGEKCDIGLPGETGGILRDAENWYPIDNMSIAYGYGLNVTGLQKCSMYATIANKGVRVAPRLILEYHKNGETIRNPNSRTFTRVLSEETALTLTNMMADVVDHGTGTNAKLENVNVCGKTGTAHIARSDARGYSDRYFSSFGGFFPKEDPKLVIYIMIRDPQGAYYGGSVAAPCFKKIADRIIQYEGENYFSEPTQMMVDAAYPVVPNLVGFKKKKAISILSQLQLLPRFTSHGEMIVAQEPVAGEPMPEDGLIYLTMNSHAIESTEKQVPLVVGLPVRNAVNLLAANELTCTLEGSGMVIRQLPAAGEPITPGEKVKLICRAAI